MFQQIKEQFHKDLDKEPIQAYLLDPSLNYSFLFLFILILWLISNDSLIILNIPNTLQQAMPAWTENITRTINANNKLLFLI